MKLVLTLALASIFAISTCHGERLKTYCSELCPFFKTKHPDKKISYMEVMGECKKGNKKIGKACAALQKLDKKTIEKGRKVYEKLTWNQACSQVCK